MFLAAERQYRCPDLRIYMSMGRGHDVATTSSDGSDGGVGGDGNGNGLTDVTTTSFRRDFASGASQTAKSVPDEPGDGGMEDMVVEHPAGARPAAPGARLRPTSVDRSFRER